MKTAGAARGGFTEAIARDALHQAAGRADVDVQAAQLLRLGENAVFQVADLVVRVARPAASAAAAQRVIDVARWFRDEHVPAVEALDIEQPVVIDGMAVTFWRSLGDGEAYGSTADLAHLLKLLHALEPTDSLALPPAEPWERAARRLGSVNLPPADHAFLVKLLADLRAKFDGLAFELPPGVLHDDASVGNVLIDKLGIPRLIDLDGVCVGPREWDLILTAIYYDRYGWHTREEYDAFVEIYGFDVMQWSGYETLADLRELIMVTWMAQNVGHDQLTADEFRKRMHALRTGSSRRDWEPY